MTARSINPHSEKERNANLLAYWAGIRCIRAYCVHPRTKGEKRLSRIPSCHGCPFSKGWRDCKGAPLFTRDVEAGKVMLETYERLAPFKLEP